MRLGRHIVDDLVEEPDADREAVRTSPGEEAVVPTSALTEPAAVGGERDAGYDDHVGPVGLDVVVGCADLDSLRSQATDEDAGLDLPRHVEIGVDPRRRPDGQERQEMADDRLRTGRSIVEPSPHGTETSSQVGLGVGDRDGLRGG